MATRPFTISDLLAPQRGRGKLLRTPALTLEALRLVHRAGRRDLYAMLAFQAAAALGAAAQLLVAREFMQRLVEVGAGAAADRLYLPLAVFAAATLGIAAARALAEQRQRLLGELVGRFAYDKIVTAASASDYAAFESPGFYDELQRAMASGELRILDMVASVSALTAALLTSAGIAAVLFAIEPLLLALTLLAGVPVLVAAVHNSGRGYAFEYAMTPESRERAYVMNLLTSRSAAKEVRLLDLSPLLWERYERLTDERISHLRDFLARRMRVSLGGAVAGATGMALALVALVLLLGDGRVGVADALTAGVAMQQLSGRLTTITGSAARLVESGLFLDDFRDFVALAAAAGASAPSAPPAARRPRGRAAQGVHVQLEHVSFRYPTRTAPALEDVSIEIRPGETVALVGDNGSGKTTLVKLIAQLYRPDAGRVVVDGVDAASLGPREIAAGMTVLFQDYVEYHLSARDNIAFGRREREPTTAAVRDAARRAGAEDFLDALPEGFDTRLGLQFQGGHELSVGQWQRLALARAFYRDGGLLILDEPTASLDARAERDLFEQIRGMSRGRSVLLISHRFSSVRSANRIYVLDRGRIAESGTHEELVALDGQYAELFALQAEAYRDRPLQRSSS